MASAEAIEALFPGLRQKNWRITSPHDPRYNCIAWAASDTTRWWWPGDPADGYTWPAGVERVETVAAFVAAFALLGYHIHSDATPEPGFEKIALYVDGNGTPTHAARQLRDGRWVSKLGHLEDIEHDLLDLCGDLYGTVALVLRRPRSERDDTPPLA